MSIDIDNLETLARAASKGPWYVREMGDDCFVEAPGSPDMAFRLDVCGDDYTGHGDEEQRRHNMQYIAAADPDAILALVTRLREAEEELAHTQGQRDAAILRAQRAEDGEQALAAHVEQLSNLWLPLSADIASLFDQQPQNMDDGSYLVDGQSAHEFAMALNDVPAHSLARRDAEQFRQGFWRGFERARCHPDQTNIRAEYEDVEELRLRQAAAGEES